MELSRIVLFVVAATFFFSVSVSPSKEISNASVYIVYVQYPEGAQPEAFHLNTLAAVLGSRAAAEDALIFHYKYAASGFAARLTPEQAQALRKQPGVLNVLPSVTYHLLGKSMSIV
ncbi:subtilisin-like protease SBT3.11 [Canna indica]|uniref:Subtilisin-like protease SBT3.11 n=1 Tax=Canna indica TaxID=4628 RepID=A0AAQ3JT38_9LILI|nr:subtilisin-like protease SBT3.11 [Canna indica]